jgi:signal transduction histidine kinase/ActR/RegA family two-component response regulator
VSNWSFQRKLTTGVILICVLVLLTTVVSLFASRSLITNMTKVTSGEGQDLADAWALQLIGLKNIADVHACLLTGGTEFVPAARAGSAKARELVNRLQGQITDPEGRALLVSVMAAELAHEDAFTHALAEAGVGAGHSGALYPQAVLARSAQYEQALAALVAHRESARIRNLAPAREAVSRSESTLISFSVANIALLVVFCLFISIALSRSYGEQTTARTLAESGQTQARESLSEVEAVGRLKDQFLAIVSHELRNPLAPILTWTQLLRSGTLDEVKTARALEVIERNVMSQTQLIDDLVDVSRVVSGKFRLDVRPVELGPVIKEAAESQTPASSAKQIALQLVLDERAGAISGDSERLKQVMSNLISNAIKFTPRGGRVQVVLQRAESHVEIAVHDTGIGIEPDFLPHVFEPFRQGTGGTMRRHGGLGLGLSIVRHIVELHGGEISVYSDGPGLGAKFTVKFPLLPKIREGVTPARRHPIAGDALASIHLGRLDGVRVLVVDDELSSSEALGVLFDSCGAEARIADSAAAALIVFDDWQPDVLVSDIAMPGEDGYSLVRKIRLRSPGRGGLTPAVALTAFAKIEDRVTILAAGFQMYLSKPANPNELIAVVGSLARRRGLGVDGVVF